MPGENLPQITLLLRLLGGGYLIYLGGSILMDGADSLLIMGAAVLFLLAGAGLLAITVPVLLRQIRQINEPKDPDSEEK